VNLTDRTEPSREGTTVTHQGRWRRTESHQPPLATYQVAELPLVWTDTPPFLSLGLQISASTALRQQFHYLFLITHMPAEMLDKSRPKSVVTRNWLLQLQEVVIQSSALDTSIAAFFTARMGRRNNDMNLVYRSRSMYLCGLERVQRAVNNTQTRFSDETLAACMALSLYELTERPGGASGAFMTHLRGAMTLLQLRGPDACTSPLGHSIFLGLRSQTVSPFPVSSGP
jgi:hypothetical protein